ncbi:MAG: hypothetical protein HYV97_00400 [Bdellovibrio sp.]|nr:hypothetical protein [Bdellovibrio sp.]
MLAKQTHLAIGIVLFAVIGCSSKNSESTSASSSSATKTISGTVTGPNGAITQGPLDFLIQPAWASYSIVSGADVRAYQIDTKGRVTASELGNGLTNADGTFEIDIPANTDTGNPNVIIVATDPQNTAKRYVSFVSGESADLGMSSSTVYMSIRSALGLTSASVNELSNTKLDDLSTIAENILLIENSPDFSSAYDAIINEESFRTKLNASTETDISNTDLIKIAPLGLPTIIRDGQGNITQATSFNVGDTITLTANAVDLFGLPLQYVFRIYRHCTLDGTLQDWSPDNDITYTFTADDLTNCTAIFLGVKNNDGTDLDGIFGDVQIGTMFTIRDGRLPPTATPLRVFDSSMNETASRSFHVGDTVTIVANASDPFGLPLEYVFRLFRNCFLASELQSWSATNSVTYTFTADDISTTGCTSIAVGVKNNDGIDMDGFFGDLQDSTGFTISF